MVSGSMSVGRIRITASPSQNGSTVNDQITGSDQPSAQSLQNHQHKQRLMHRGSSCMATLAMLGGTHNESLALFIQREAASQGSTTPTLQPVTLVLVVDAPHTSQATDDQ